MGIELDGKVAIVTGGARGIGKGMATALLKAGAAVTITDIREETLAQTSTEFDKIPGAKHVAVVADGTKDEDVNNAVQKTVDAFGRIDVAFAGHNHVRYRRRPRPVNRTSRRVRFDAPRIFPPRHETAIALPKRQRQSA